MRRRALLTCVAPLALALASGALAATTFTNVSGTDWNNAANWSGGTVPAAGDDVIINGNVTLTNSTAALNSYVLSATKFHTFNGTNTILNALTVTIAGTMTHTNNLATNAVDGVWYPNAKVQISCADITVAAGGKIDVNGKGYRGGFTVNSDGFGPGGGSFAAKGGGGYGSAGGRAAGAYGQPYGNPHQPVDPGSGGNSGNPATRVGGNGGGVVRIMATGVVTVNGTISANGAGRVAWYEASAGSGGSVFITCNTIAGASTGLISADAEISSTGSGGGGGGGRIAVIYNTVAQSQAAPPLIRFTLGGGQETSQWTQPGGEVGTLYFPDNQILTRGPDTIRHSGVWMSPMSRLDRDTLTLDGAWLKFPYPGFVLNITNNLTVKGSDILKHKLELYDGTIQCGGDMVVSKTTVNMFRSQFMTGIPTVHCGGDMAVSNSAVCRIFAVPISETSGLVEVAGTLTVSGSAWIYPSSHPMMGGSIEFRVGSLKVPVAGSGINADGLGFAGGTNAPGMGPGGGDRATNGGGGYGGFGGLHTAVYGLTNGIAAAPLLPGSGGGSGNEAAVQGWGGAGGGAVSILAKEILLNGSIVANGQGNVRNGSSGGGGSGGGIFIRCNDLYGTNGILTANGGPDAGFGNTGTGGGGRIAIWLGVHDFLWPQYMMGMIGGATVTNELSTLAGTLTAAAGAIAGSAGTVGTPGTVMVIIPPPLGSIIIIR